MTIEVNDTDTDPATYNVVQQELQQMMSDNEVVLGEAPLLSRVDECSDTELNDCSSNAVCTDEEEGYSCACTEDYPMDMSYYINEPGRVCAKSCEGIVCTHGDTCIPVEESVPLCTCPTGAICGLNLWITVGVALAALIILCMTVVAAVYIGRRRSTRTAAKISRDGVAVQQARVMMPHHSLYMASSLSGKPRHVEAGPSPILPAPYYDNNAYERYSKINSRPVSGERGHRSRSRSLNNTSNGYTYAVQQI